MKKISIILIATLSFLACKKDGKNDSPSNSKNTVTYTTNGKTYTVSEANSNTGNPPLTYVDCFISRSDNFTRFWLQVEGAELPFNFLIDSFNGPASGIGTFNLIVGDGNVQENFSGGQGYSIKGGGITITEASNTRIVGTFTLQSSTKTVTGTFTINQPVE